MNFLKNIFRSYKIYKERKLDLEVKNLLIKRYGVCPICEKELTNHSIYDLGYTFYEEENPNLSKIKNFAERKDWLNVNRIKDWAGDKDIYVCRIIECSNVSGYGMFYVIDPYDMWADIFVEKKIKLDEKDISKLKKILKNLDRRQL